jgi:hypothetical protein
MDPRERSPLSTVAQTVVLERGIGGKGIPTTRGGNIQEKKETNTPFNITLSNSTL